MSMTEPADILNEPWDDVDVSPSLVRAVPAAAPIVPKNSISGHSLAAVVAIMTFLASLTIGAAMMIVSAASDWQSQVAREITIQIRPVPGHDIEADVGKAAELARAAPGVAEVRAYTKQESARLVEPWLGSGLALDDLPIPRLIVLKLVPGARPDFAGFSQNTRSAGDDREPRRSSPLDRQHARDGGNGDRGRHRGAGSGSRRHRALDHLRDARSDGDQPADRRGAALCRRHRQVHLRPVSAPFPGARFQGRLDRRRRRDPAVRHHGGRQCLAFRNTRGGDQVVGLFGNFSIGVAGYLAIVLQIVFMALVTAFASRHTVNRTLAAID